MEAATARGGLYLSDGSHLYRVLTTHDKHVLLEDAKNPESLLIWLPVTDLIDGRWTVVRAVTA